MQAPHPNALKKSPSMMKNMPNLLSAKQQKEKAMKAKLEFPFKCHGNIGGKLPTTLPLKKVSYHGSVFSFGSTWTVKTHWYNPTQAPVKTIFEFRETGIIHSFTVEREGKKIRAGILPTSKVLEAKVEDSGASGAYLLEKHKDLYSLLIGTLAPGAECSITIKYDREVDIDEEEAKIRVAMPPKHIRQSGADVDVDIAISTTSSRNLGKINTLGPKTEVALVDKQNATVKSKVRYEADQAAPEELNISIGMEQIGAPFVIVEKRPPSSCHCGDNSTDHNEEYDEVAVMIGLSPFPQDSSFGAQLKKAQSGFITAASITVVPPQGSKESPHKLSNLTSNSPVGFGGMLVIYCWLSSLPEVGTEFIIDAIEAGGDPLQWKVTWDGKGAREGLSIHRMGTNSLLTSIARKTSTTHLFEEIESRAKEISRMGLDYHMITPYTALVGLEGAALNASMDTDAVTKCLRATFEATASQSVSLTSQFIQPVTPIEKLFLENKKWADEIKSVDPEYFQRLSHLQTPQFLWIGCSDSRVPADRITGTQPGEIFVHRNIANLVVHTDVNLLSVLDYAVTHLKVQHVIVCGHYGCGGVKAAMGNHDFKHVLNMWLRNIKDVYSMYKEELEKIEDSEKRADKLVELNVTEQVKHLAHTSVIQRFWKREGRPQLHGWVYGLKDGLIKPVFTMDPSSIKDIEPVYQFDEA